MKVGDLVKTNFGRGQSFWHWGVITKIKGRQIECLWHDGDVSWCGIWHVEVICK